MIVYWSMYALPAILAALYYRSEQRSALAATAFVLFLFFWLMAFRETGGDFYTYNLFYEDMQNSPFSRVTSSTEFLYGLANWISMRLDWGIYGVNAICAVIFLVSFYMFVRHEPYPLLSLAVATAYFIIVVAIGYTRQGVAAGLLLWATVYLRHREPKKYLALIALAIGFHTSAAIGLVFVYFALNIKSLVLKQLSFVAVFLIAAGSVYLAQVDTYEQYITGYVETDRYSSDGAVARLAMSWVAAFALIVMYRFWPKSDRKIWAAYAAFAIALAPALLISSTVADRLGLYVIALQVVVFGRMPMFGRTDKTRILLFLATVAIYALVLGVWLYVGNFAQDLWVPYESLLLGVIE